MNPASLAIPQTNPHAAYEAQAAEIEAAIARVLRGGRYLLGPETEAFETEWAEYIGVDHAVTAASGTDALHLALRGCGVGPGDEVITVAHTAVATVAAIDLCGATPILVDIEPETFQLDPRQLENARTERTRAVVLVHLYGIPADVEAVQRFCRSHELRLIEDCAQAHGARYRGQRVGSFGDAAAFSFYPTKNLGAIGDGGAVVTRDAALAGNFRSLRQYGWRRERYVSDDAGWNGRIDEIQAAILRVKLRRLDADNECRRALAARYRTGLAGIPALVLPTACDERHAVFHQYVVRCRDRGGLARHLHAGGVGTLIHYPVSIDRQPAYINRRLSAGAMTETHRAANEVLSLPMYPQMPLESVERVASLVQEYFSSGDQDTA